MDCGPCPVDWQLWAVHCAHIRTRLGLHLDSASLLYFTIFPLSFFLHEFMHIYTRSYYILTHIYWHTGAHSCMLDCLYIGLFLTTNEYGGLPTGCHRRSPAVRSGLGMASSGGPRAVAFLYQMRGLKARLRAAAC